MADRTKLSVAVDPASNRLQLLTPFKAWDGKDITDCAVLIKVGAALRVRVCGRVACAEWGKGARVTRAHIRLPTHARTHARDMHAHMRA